jgi:hypothetical protein
VSAHVDDVELNGFSQTRITGSALERAEACPISFSLPIVTRAGVFAERGTVIHAFLRARLIGADLKTALEKVPDDEKDTCRGINVDELVGDLEIVRSEVAYAIDVRALTVRELGVNIERKYESAALEHGGPLNDYEIPLTIDLEGRTRNGIEVAGDAKTGFRPILPAKVHRQVHAEVLARRIAAGVDVVSGKLFKIAEGGSIKIDAHLFEPLELDEIADELLEIVVGVQRARKRFQEREELVMNPGPWCEHCPAAPCCPARMDLARAIVTEGGKVVAALASLTPEQEWDVWQQVSAGRTLLEEIRDNMKLVARQRFMAGEPITSPDGSKIVKPIEKTKAGFNQQMALALLAQLGATQAQINRLWTPATYEEFRVVNAPKAKALRTSKKKSPELEQPPQPKLLGDGG